MPAPMRDSLSRCESNPYSLQQMKQTTKPISASSTNKMQKDTIELTHEMLQKEALSRLRHTSKQSIAQNGFMRVGKVLFMAVAIPPYLILYGIPKWVLVVVLPSTMAFFGVVQNKIKQKLKQKIQKVIKFVQVVVKKGLNKLQIFIQPVANILLEIKNMIQQVRHYVALFSNQIINTAKKPFESIKKGRDKLKAMGNRSQEFIKKVIGYFAAPIPVIKDKINWFQQYAKALFKQSVDKLKKIPLPVVQWQRSQQLASQATMKVQVLFNASKDSVKAVTEKLVETIKMYAQPLVKFYRQVKAILNQNYQKLSSHIQRTLNFIKQKKEQFTFAGSSAFAGLPTFIRKHLDKPLVRKGIEMSVKGFYSIIIFFLQTIDWILKMVGIVLGTIFKVIQILANVVQKFILIVMEQVIAGFAIIGKGFRFGLYHFLVWSLMGCILVMWGFQAINRVGGRILQPRKTT